MNVAENVSGFTRLRPRFCVVRVSTTDPTRDDDPSCNGKAFVFSWLGFTLEVQFARENLA